MRRTNTVIAIKPGPAPRVVLTQGAEKRGLTIRELAQYLGMTNWAAEEALREGKIRFKWMGKRKVVDRRDADTYFESLPYAEVEIKEPKPRELKSGSESKSYMSDQELRVRGLHVYRANGSTTQRKRVRMAKVLGFKKDANGNICVQYS
jgi:excisionase family DNA binding protein